MVVPADWKEVRLGDLGPLSKGVGIRKNEVTPYGIPCVRYGQIYTDYNFVIGEIQTFVSPQVASNSRPLRKGEILFAGSGETKEDIGKCIAYVEDVGAVAGGDIVILTPEGADSRFLGYSLNSPNVAKQKMSRAQGDAVVHISAANLASIVLDLPPLKEQEAIAEALSDADSAIKSLDALIAKKRDVKQATMQQLLTGHTRLPGFTGDWNWKTLGEVTSLIPGGVYGEESPHSQLIGMPVATTAHIEMSDRWNDKEMSIRYFSKEQILTYAPQFGDLIVVKSSGSAASIQSGKLGFVDVGRAGKFIFSNFLMLLRPVNILPKFLYYYVSSHNVKRLIPTLVEASTYPNIRIPEYLQVQICVPPLKEQEAIAEALTVMDDELEALTEQVFKFRMVKEGMMQDLLTGKVRLV